MKMTSTSDIHVDLAFFAKKWNKNFAQKGLSYPSEKRGLVTIVKKQTTLPTSVLMRREKRSQSMKGVSSQR
jgi:hypothetical protein